MFLNQNNFFCYNSSVNSFIENNKAWLRIVLLVAYVVILILPGYVFFGERGGFESFQGNSFKTFAALVFPLFGLYAFTFVWLQTLIGMNMFIFSRLFGNGVYFHRAQGLFALLLATTHALAIPYIYSLQRYIGYKFLQPDLQVFALLGTIAYTLLLLTITAALLRRAKFMRKFWRYIHWGNYLVFSLIFIHSLNLGSDTQKTILNPLWYFYAATFLISLGFRIYRATFTKTPANTDKPAAKLS